jgi:hypothetical protein
VEPEPEKVFSPLELKKSELKLDPGTALSNAEGSVIADSVDRDVAAF